MKNWFWIISAGLSLWASGSIADCVDQADFEDGVLVEQTAEPHQLVYRREIGGLVLELPEGVGTESRSNVQRMVFGHPLIPAEIQFTDGTFQRTDLVNVRGDWQALPDAGQWIAFVSFVARNGEETGGTTAFYFAQSGEEVVGECTYATWVIDVSTRWDLRSGNDDYRIHFSPELGFPLRMETRNGAGRFEDVQQIVALERLS